MNWRRQAFLIFSIVAIAADYATITGGKEAASSKETVVDAAGNLEVPCEYRTDYEYLGSGAVAASTGVDGSKQLHVVSASPGSISAYRASGQ